MILLDKIIIGFSIAWILMPVIAFLVRLVKRSKPSNLSANFWVSWGNVLLLNLMALVRNHVSFYRTHSTLVLAAIFLWAVVLAWNWLRVSEKARQMEVAEGPVPKVYNDWAKPDNS